MIILKFILYFTDLNPNKKNEEFLNEGLLMKDSIHPNVLNLIGICFDTDESPLVILPFMSNGDLLSYIRNENNQPTIRDLLIFGIDVSKDKINL